MVKKSKSHGKSRGSGAKPFKKEPPTLPLELRKKLWEYLQTVGHRPVGVTEIGNSLSLDASQQRKVRRFLKHEAKEGVMTPFRRGRYMLKEEMLGKNWRVWDTEASKPKRKRASQSPGVVRVASKENVAPGAIHRGVLTVHPNGFGFVSRKEGEDLFIPPQYINGAIHGDEVVVKEMWDAERGGSAQVLQIAVPFAGRLVGRVYRKNKQLFLHPDNERYSDLPAVWQGKREDGEPGQWAVAQVSRSPWDQDHIWAEVERWLPAQEGPALDRARSAAVLEADHFPPEVLEAAEQIAIQPTPEIWEGRLDLRKLPLFTIDGDDARDFDDAVGIEYLSDGTRRVTVAIADVSHYVREDSMIDEEALRRGTSVYFPASCLPMLPEALSNSICSLRPNENRLVMVAIMDYNKDAKRVKVSLHEAVMYSHARLTYSQVAELLDQPEGLSEDHPTTPLRDSILALHELAQELRGRRLRKGSIDLDLPEPRVILDEHGEIKDIRRGERHPSQQLIEELMLQANETVAEFFMEHDIPGIYRVHDEPDSKKIDAYMELVERLGLSAKLNLQREAPKHQSHLWKLDPRFFGSVLEQIKDHPAQQLLNQTLLRSMKQATYQVENTGHFGLGIENYLHFTSPIRRYPDLEVHRMLKRYLHGTLPKGKKQRAELIEQLDEIATHSSARERLAMRAERDVLARYRARFIQNYIGQTFDGTVTSIAPFGLFVELDNFFVEGLIHLRNLPGEYHFDDKIMQMVGPRSGDSFKLGDRLHILIEDASPLRGEIDFSLLERIPSNPIEATRE